MKKLLKLMMAVMVSFTLFACNSAEGSLDVDKDGNLSGASLGKATGTATIEKVSDKEFVATFDKSDLGVVIGALVLDTDEHLEVDYNVTGGHFNYSPGTTYKNDKRTLELFKKLRENFKPSGLSGEGSQPLDISDGTWLVAIFTNGGVTGTATFKVVKDETPEPEATEAPEGQETTEETAEAPAEGTVTETTEAPAEQTEAPVEPVYQENITG